MIIKLYKDYSKTQKRNMQMTNKSTKTAEEYEMEIKNLADELERIKEEIKNESGRKVEIENI